MGWEERNGTKFFYRSVREGRHVRKVYFGRGTVARMAATTAARIKAERLAQQKRRLAERAEIQHVLEMSRRLERLCKLLLDGVLMSVGLHRPHRKSWRPWHEAQEILRQGATAEAVTP